jgi:hypothetical protein
VLFYGDFGWQTRYFTNGTSFRTGNAAATISVQFKGPPQHAVAVNGQLCW